MKNLSALACGLLFGLGLALSGMTDTQKVLGFLDLFGEWIPDLMLVMGAAVCVTLASFRVILSRKPVFDETMNVPAATAIDMRLVMGAVLFGIGWGVFGYCPGPALSALVYFNTPTLVFVLSMLGGMGMASVWTQRQ